MERVIEKLDLDPKKPRDMKEINKFMMTVQNGFYESLSRFSTAIKGLQENKDRMMRTAALTCNKGSKDFGKIPANSQLGNCKTEYASIPGGVENCEEIKKFVKSETHSLKR